MHPYSSLRAVLRIVWHGSFVADADYGGPFRVCLTEVNFKVAVRSHGLQHHESSGEWPEINTVATATSQDLVMR
jgi:hypothetical protein